MTRQRVKCLLVDDLEENLLALAAVLQRADVELFTARSGAEALDLLLSHEMALAILDVQMPEMDGFELAELMRGSQRTRDVPLIFVTAGNRDPQRLFRGYDYGAVDFLYKPIDPLILASKADVFFELYRQKQRLAEELQARTETLRLNEMFMAVLGHDLRNPLHAIMMNANVMRLSSPDDETIRGANNIIAAGSRMSRMIEDMLDLARIRLGSGLVAARMPADLAPVFERVVDEHCAGPHATAISAQYRGTFTGEWDCDRLAQAISNLLGNAMQHGSPGQPVRVEFDGSAADRVAVTVSNAGTIPAELQSRLFEPFAAKSAVHNGNGGLGLGLYIVREIARAHRGDIDMTSEGGETIFRLIVARHA